MAHITEMLLGIVFECSTNSEHGGGIIGIIPCRLLRARRQSRMVAGQGAGVAALAVLTLRPDLPSPSHDALQTRS